MLPVRRPRSPKPSRTATPDFWNRTQQNWRSELLAVAAMVVLSFCLRRRGSPESRPAVCGDRLRRLGTALCKRPVQLFPSAR
ncbi:DUF6766 family protein [Streptomyces nojiriensis]